MIEKLKISPLLQTMLKASPDAIIIETLSTFVFGKINEIIEEVNRQEEETIALHEAAWTAIIALKDDLLQLRSDKISI